MTQRTALITGSTSGIGLGIANALAEQGYNICLSGIEPIEQGTDIAQDLAKKQGVRTSYYAGNLLDSSIARGALTHCERTLAPVDILVNNAGIQHVEAIDTFPPEKWCQIIELNLITAFHMIQAALPHMKAQGWGRIINNSSTHGLVASPFKSAYVAAKHGLIGLTKTVAWEVGEYGITCNAVCPGYTWTPLVEKQIPETAKARSISEQDVIEQVLLKEHATKQFTQISELGAYVAFLSSDAAKNITGTALPMDGGWTAK